MKELFKVTTGSKLHGFATKDSDTDTKIVYRNTLSELTAVNPPSPPKNYTTDTEDVSYFELRNLARLLKENNLTAVEVAASSLVQGLDGDVYPDLLQSMLAKTIDTDAYPERCRRFIKAMNTDNPKHQYHARRMYGHVIYYLQTGVLDFDARKYHNYEQIKAAREGVDTSVSDFGELPPAEYPYITQALYHEVLDRLVANEYRKDITWELKLA